MKGLEFIKIKELLTKYNIPFCPSELIEKEEEAFLFAETFGYPVVLKIFSIEGIHKTDQGLLKLNIKNKEELIDAFKELKSSLFNKNGILIQKQIFGIETVIGMKRDDQFGPILMFGSGGILIELIKDVSFRISPIKERDAIEMIKETKGYKLLKGFRGEKPVDIKKLSNIILSLSKLSLLEKDIKEIDLNPVIINQEGAFIVDPRIILN